jgi:predicted TIM-barrel fold metal-dependent hydrolase
MVIDAHVYLGQSLYGYSQQVDELLHKMDRLEIDHAILWPVKPRGYNLAESNGAVAAAVRQHPDRFSGIARVDPWQGDAALRELQRGIEELGLRGLLLHPWEELCPVNSPRVDPLVAYAISQAVPVLMAAGHPRVSHASQIGDLADRFPEAALVVTHAGQLNISGRGLYDATLLFTSHRNVWLETSGVYRQDFLEAMVRRIGAERLVFGSGAPRYDQGLELARVRNLALDADQLTLVTGEALAACFGLR